MKNRLWIAIVVLVALSAAVIWKTRERAAEPGAGGAAAGEDLAAVFGKVPAGAIDTLEIKTADTKEAVRLERHGEKQGGAWRVVAPVEAPADEAAPADAVERLEKLTLVRRVTDSKDNHARLGVEEEKATLVKAFSGGKELVAMLVGGYGSGSTFVRKVGSDVVYAAEGSIAYAFNKELRSWRDRRMTNFAAKDVTAVSWKVGKDTFRFVRDPAKADDAKAWTVDKGAKAPPKFDPAKVQSLVSGLASMRASDFGPKTMKASAIDDTNAVAVATLTLSEKPEGATERATRAVVIRLGASKPSDEAAEGASTQHFVTVDANPVVFVVSDYLAKRISPKLEDFQVSEKPEGDAAPGAMPVEAQMGGADTVPPEIMRQLQEQMRRQGGQP